MNGSTASQMIGQPGCRNDCAISPWGMRSSFRWSRPWASGSAHWPRTSSAVDGRFSWVSKGAAAPLWHTTLLAKSSVLHLGSGRRGKGAARGSGKHLFCGRRMRGWAWQLMVSAHPAQACRGTNGVRSPVLPQQRFSYKPQGK